MEQFPRTGLEWWVGGSAGGATDCPKALTAQRTATPIRTGATELDVSQQNPVPCIGGHYRKRQGLSRSRQVNVTSWSVLIMTDVIPHSQKDLPLVDQSWSSGLPTMRPGLHHRQCEHSLTLKPKTAQNGANSTHQHYGTGNVIVSGALGAGVELPAGVVGGESR